MNQFAPVHMVSLLIKTGSSSYSASVIANFSTSKADAKSTTYISRSYNAIVGQKFQKPSFALLGGVKYIY